MHPSQHPFALRRLQALIARETGAPLRGAAVAEMEAILQGRAEADHPGADVAPASPSNCSCAAVQEVTLLWADLRGFEALADTQPAERVMAALNRCIARLMGVVERHAGHIDQCTGDALRVLFGVPHAQEDDVQRAVLCAVELQMAMRDLNLEHLRERLPEVFLGIGVHTGKVLVGCVEVAGQTRHTVLGEAVSQTARLEAFSLRGQVLISEATYDRAWGLVSASAPVQVHVQGREQPLRLRELVAIPSRRLKVPRQEFRRSHRVAARLPCEYQRIAGEGGPSASVKAAIRDIGYHGLLLEAPEPLALHSELRLAFDLPLVDYRATGVQARVIALQPETGRGTWMARLEFTSLSADSLSRVQMFVQLLVGGAAA